MNKKPYWKVTKKQKGRWSEKEWLENTTKRQKATKKIKRKIEVEKQIEKETQGIPTIIPNAKGVMAGYRPDIKDSLKRYPENPKGLYFRSAWEANYARYLMWMLSQGHIQRFEYESNTFWFPKIKRGVRSYLPDFKVWESLNKEPHFVEVKGRLDSKSATKLKRMAKYFPDVELRLVDGNVYHEIKNKLSTVIPNWE
tara:strand:- start:8314 stop:8904 length:591 start_codon:yes stop_codon:yes gene_type:complete